MPTIGTTQLPLPDSWDEFEDICADLFMLEWKFQNTVRHGRSGQRQNGVDIYGCPNKDEYVGVQCKGKQNWPPSKLTISEIDLEVKKALDFKPDLTEFIIATTTQDDAIIQGHCRKLSQRHLKKGRFSITVLGWGELSRRLTRYPELIEKYYSYIGLTQVWDKISSLPQDLAELQTTSVYPVDLIDEHINVKLDTLRKGRFFVGYDSFINAIKFSDKVISGVLKGGSNKVRANSLAWTSRILASKDLRKATEIWNEASKLSKSDYLIIAEAFIIAAEGKQKSALAKLSTVNSAASKSAAFYIVKKNQGIEEAFNWLKMAQLNFNDLDPDGKYYYLIECFKLEDWSELFDNANSLKEEDYSQTPSLLYLSAFANLVQAVPEEFRLYVTKQIPFESDRFPPLASDNQSLTYLWKARELFDKCAKVAEELNLKQIANVSLDYALWLELRNPKSRDVALKKLKSSMFDPEHSLRRLSLALHFGIKLDLEAKNREIDQQVALTGGYSTETAFARFVLACTQNTSEACADYIERYRDDISQFVDKVTIGDVEVQVLAKAGRIEDAERCLSELQLGELDHELEKRLKRIISEVKGKDPVTGRIEDYQKAPTLNKLVNLVDLLKERKDSERLCHFGALLFEQTHSLEDAEQWATSLNEAGQYNKLSSLLRNNPDLRSQSYLLQAHWCWVLYREGNIKECLNGLNTLGVRNSKINLNNLAINLAIASGQWENVLPIVDDEWHPVYKAGSLRDEKADLSQYGKNLFSCSAVIDKLKHKGQLTVSDEAAARAYLSVNEKRWPNEQLIEDGAILYLDNLAAKYLHNLGLLQKLGAAGLIAYVSSSETDETKALLRYEGLAVNIDKKIEELRATLAEGISSGKVKLGPLPLLEGEEQTEFRLHPTVGIFEIARLAEAIGVDDRSMNNHLNFNTGSRLVPILTSLDLLHILKSLGKIKFNDMLEYRTRLRQSGFVFVPVNEEELHHHISSAEIEKGQLLETAELKAIRENILQVRMTGALLLPKEAYWLSNLMQVVMRLLKSQWTQGVDVSNASARSNWLLQFLDLRGWSHAHGQEVGIEMASHAYKNQIALLLIPPKDSSKVEKERYFKWVDDSLMVQLRNENPDIFSKIVQYARDEIDKIANLTAEEINQIKERFPNE